MTIATSMAIKMIIGEIAALTAWYALTDRELYLLLLGTSLGLKANNVVIPDLELAIVSQKPELFLGTTKGGCNDVGTKIGS